MPPTAPVLAGRPQPGERRTRRLPHRLGAAVAPGAARRARDRAMTSLDVGLGHLDPAWDLRDGGNRTSPVNATMFAGAGGDGVHFSVLNVASGDSGAAPVVMTVPMAFDSPNHIVGGDLREFLA